MKKVIKKTRPAHVLGGRHQKKEQVFSLNLSWLKWSLKIQWKFA